MKEWEKNAMVLAQFALRTPMRPDPTTRQYKDSQHHAGAYWQIGYTHRLKSRTEYIRRESVTEPCRRIVTHNWFKRLVDQGIGLRIEH